MQSVECTLKERAGRMYRQLLILNRIFQQQSDPDADWMGAGTRNAALCEAIREVIDELTDHAGVIMSAPFPISEWRPGDGPDDERWRALTEMERRELLALVSRYEDLIAWSEAACGAPDTSQRPAGNSENLTIPGRTLGGALARRDADDYLQAQRAQLGRFRKEMMFLERRRNTG